MMKITKKKEELYPWQKCGGYDERNNLCDMITGTTTENHKCGFMRKCKSDCPFGYVKKS